MLLPIVSSSYSYRDRYQYSGYMYVVSRSANTFYFLQLIIKYAGVFIGRSKKCWRYLWILPLKPPSKFVSRNIFEEISPFQYFHWRGKMYRAPPPGPGVQWDHALRLSLGHRAIRISLTPEGMLLSWFRFFNLFFFFFASDLINSWILAFCVFYPIIKRNYDLYFGMRDVRTSVVVVPSTQLPRHFVRRFYFIEPDWFQWLHRSFRWLHFVTKLYVIGVVTLLLLPVVSYVVKHDQSHSFVVDLSRFFTLMCPQVELIRWKIKREKMITKNNSSPLLVTWAKTLLLEQWFCNISRYT